MDADVDYSLFSSYFLHRCNFIFLTEGLASGYSVDIDGQLILCRGPQLHPNHPFHSQTLHYKVLENHFKLFGVGLASGII